MLKNFRINWLFLVLLGTTLQAQQTPYFSLTQYQLNLINPAYAGVSGDLFTIGSKSQWSNVEGAPRTFAFTYSTQSTEKVGMGISVISDKVNVEQQTLAFIDFSYKLTLAEDMRLYLGLKAGGNFYSSDPSGLVNYLTPPDPSKVAMRQFTPNFGVGAYLDAGSFWVSLSAPRLLEANRSTSDEMYAKERIHSYAAAGTSIEVSEKIDLLPSVIFRKVMGLPLSTEFTAQLRYMDRFQFGGQIRDVSNMSIFALVNVSPKIDVGYAYDNYLDTELSGMTVNGHEFFLRFRLGTKDFTENADVEGENPEQGGESPSSDQRRR